MDLFPVLPRYQRRTLGATQGKPKLEGCRTGWAKEMLLDYRKLRIREQDQLLDFEDQYELVDLDSRETVGFAQEVVSHWVKVVRALNLFQFWLNIEWLLPTKIVVKEIGVAKPVLTLKRSVSLMQSVFEVFDRQKKSIGLLRSKPFSLGGGFSIHNPSGEQIATVKGTWLGLDFQFIDMDGEELGVVRWVDSVNVGVNQGDEYIITLKAKEGKKRMIASLLLAASLAIDVVFKGRGQGNLRNPAHLDVP